MIKVKKLTNISTDRNACFLQNTPDVRKRWFQLFLTILLMNTNTVTRVTMCDSVGACDLKARMIWSIFLYFCRHWHNFQQNLLKFCMKLAKNDAELNLAQLDIIIPVKKIKIKCSSYFLIPIPTTITTKYQLSNTNYQTPPCHIQSQNRPYNVIFFILFSSLVPIMTYFLIL